MMMYWPSPEVAKSEPLFRSLGRGPESPQSWAPPPPAASAALAVAAAWLPARSWGPRKGTLTKCAAAKSLGRRRPAPVTTRLARFSCPARSEALPRLSAEGGLQAKGRVEAVRPGVGLGKRGGEVRRKNHARDI